MSGEEGSPEYYAEQRKREAREVDMRDATTNLAQGNILSAKCDTGLTFRKETESDPWKHRSSGMKCATCMWYVEKAVPPVTKVGYQRIGRCRRHAPSMNGYPVVYPADWCGDHKLDEMKL